MVGDRAPIAMGELENSRFVPLGDLPRELRGLRLVVISEARPDDPFSGLELIDARPEYNLTLVESEFCYTPDARFGHAVGCPPGAEAILVWIAS